MQLLGKSHHFVSLVGRTVEAFDGSPPNRHPAQALILCSHKGWLCPCATQGGPQLGCNYGHLVFLPVDSVTLCAKQSRYHRNAGAVSKAVVWICLFHHAGCKSTPSTA